MFRRSLLGMGLAVLLMAAAADAQGPAPETPAIPETDLAAPTAADGLLDTLAGAGEGVRDAAQSAGSGLADAAGAVGQAVVDVLVWSGQALATLAAGTAALGGAVAAALARGAGSLVTAGASGLAGTGAIVALGVATVVSGVAAALGAVAGAVAWIASAYLGIISVLRPSAVPEPAFAAAAAGGAVASAAAVGYAGWGHVRRWIWSLLGLGGVGGFSRIKEGELLEHPMRRRLFEAIQQEPGIHASALARRVGAGWGTIVHHLQKLEKARLVTARTVNNQKCFFEQGGDVSRQDMAVASAVKDGTAARIAQFVEHHPLSAQKDVAQTLGISPALASFHVKKLVAQGALERVRDGKAWLLATTDSFHRVRSTSGQAAVRPAVPVRAVA